MSVTPPPQMVVPQIFRLFLIGNICQQWSILEYTFAQAIWHMLKLDEETGKIVTGGLDMVPRYKMALNLAKHTKQKRPFINAIEKARDAIQDKLDVRRNRAVHGVPFIHADGSMSTEVHRGRGDRKRTPLPNDELDKLGEQIHAVSEALRDALRSFVPMIAEDAAKEAAMMAAVTSGKDRMSESSSK